MSATRWKRDTTGLTEHARRRAQQARQRVDQAITTLVRENKPINFNSVASTAGVTKSYLYTQSDIRERIEGLRKTHAPVKKHRLPASERTDASKEMLLAAKDRRIQALETENRRLKEELKKVLAKVYDRL